jgi:hypothetical protein
MIDRRADGSRVPAYVDGPQEEGHWDFKRSSSSPSSSGTSLSVIKSSSSECSDERLLDPTRVRSSGTVSASDFGSTSEPVQVVAVGDGKAAVGEPNGSRWW